MTTIVATARPNTDFFSGPPRSTPTTTTTKTIIKRVVQSVPSALSTPSSSPARLPKSTTSSPLSSPPSSSPESSPPKKRKSNSSGGSWDADALLPRERKRVRTDKPRKRVVSAPKPGKRASSSSKTRSPSPEPLLPSSRSRSVSQFANADDLPVQKRCWAAEPGHLGGDFTEADHFTSENAVALHLRTYRQYFKDPSDPTSIAFKPSPKDSPVVELEYPNTDAVERFILLEPKDREHYNPIFDIETALNTIVQNYLTPDQQAMFGVKPNDSVFDSDDSPIDGEFPHGRPRPQVAARNLLRLVQRAIHQKDGPAFINAINEANSLLRDLKYQPIPQDPFLETPPNGVTQMVHSWTNKELPKKVLMRIIEENYQRSVGPHVKTLKRYEAFSSAVYGELMPSLVYKIIRQTGLTADSLFLDLGSGVGNIVVQASLQAGCRSYGIELNPQPAKVAHDMARNFRVRCQMWGLQCGDIEVEEGDMLTSKRVDELIPQADVVVVDNKAFPQSLNEQLRRKFLDLKEGAYVVSLAPFVQGANGRVTQRNVDDISTIFEVKEFQYHSGDVSWGNGGGSYYVHRVDRQGYAEMRAHLERGSSGRSSRSSRRRS
ncbi:Histone-lysine N-methyltransferase, H3 lysine-79 specific [Mycena kentingensis (nom. inval.)]|nr:Histone-lysine N-methyltransferase, H3 lysine-79 specific [Mycena kentingensis (nom. inval.)]